MTEPGLSVTFDAVADGDVTVVCSGCGAQVSDQATHASFHDRLLRVVETVDHARMVRRRDPVGSAAEALE